MKFLAALSVAVAVGGGVVTSARASSKMLQVKSQMHKTQTTINFAKRFIAHDRSVIRAGVEWVPIGPNVAYLDPHPSIVNHRKHIALMKRVIHRAKRQLAYLARKYRALVLPPHYSQWLCIHGYEGAWNSNTGNGYYGGLQMDWGFMSRYGSSLLKLKGPASNWTPLEQMWVAEKAYSSGRGFGPWPNTARYCGLL